MKKAAAVMILLAGGLFAAPRISIGVNFGAPVAGAVVRPACPGPGYSWVDGYYAPNGGWVAGYWAPPARVAPRYAVAPRYERARDFDSHYDRHYEHGFDHFRR
jgi:hypothetical protein